MEIADSRPHLDALRNEYGLYYAALSDQYRFVWLRDTIYMLLGYEAIGDKDAVRQGVWALYDRILVPYSFKIDWRMMEGAPPQGSECEYLHPRYLPDGRESDEEWGWTQHDAVAAVLWGVLRFDRTVGGVFRNPTLDRHMMQKLVWYLQAVNVPDLPDNGVWEESRTIHLSTLASVYAALDEAYHAGFIVNRHYVARIRGAVTTMLMGPRESLERQTDLAMLTAVWPFGASIPVGDDLKRDIVFQVEKALATAPSGPRTRGVIRYPGDRYRGVPDGCHCDCSVEWPLGFGLLALAFNELGMHDNAVSYLAKLEENALPDGSFPESWCPNCGAYVNAPLGWTQSLHLIAKSALGS